MLNSVSLVAGCYLEAVWYCELVITCDAELGLGPRDMVRAITGALQHWNYGQMHPDRSRRLGCHPPTKVQ